MRTLVLACLLFAGFAQASPLVHVRSTRSDGAVSHGSGVALGDDLVLTARHVLACGVHDGVEVDGERYTARVVASSPGDDLALLRVRGLKRPALKLGPAPDAPVKVLGIRSTLDSAPLRWADGVSVAMEAVRLPGDSGGPVLDADGRLVGVVTDAARGGLGEGFALATGVGAITRFLDERPRGACRAADRRQVAWLAAIRDLHRAGEAERAVRLGRRPVGDLVLRRAADSRLARALVTLGRTDEALDVLDAALAREPEDLRRGFERARVELLAGRVDAEAISALAEHPEAGLLLRLASERLTEAGQPARAVELADWLVDLHGERPHLLAARCHARRRFGDLAGALADCTAARTPGGPLAALLEGAALALDLQDPVGARALLDEASTRAASPTLSLLRALAELAADGDPEVAVAWADDALAAEPSGAGWYLRAVALAVAGELDPAREAAETARTLEPRDPRPRALARALEAGVPVVGVDGTGALRLGPVVGD